MNNLINVGLYGLGTRDSRLRAEYIFCDCAEECSAYKNGKCFCVTVFCGNKCPLGRVTYKDGGTKRGKAYQWVWNEAKRHECYGRLSYPTYNYITRIGGKTCFTVPYIGLESSEEKELKVRDPLFGSRTLLVDEDWLTPDNIMRICAYKPHALLGGVIEKYQEKVVPEFLRQLSELYPDKFSDFCKTYPEYEIKAPDFVGRTAVLRTCNLQQPFIYDGDTFRLEGDYLVCDDYSRNAFLPFGAKTCKLKIKLTDDLRITINDNRLVKDGTVLV